ncbi:MAG: cation-transporting P-type ATPase [Candidatus Peregrinibacteria bacterium]
MENLSIVYYQQAPEEIFKALNTQREGLSDLEVKNRLGMYGPNKLVEIGRESLFIKVLRQLKDLMVLVLIVAGFLSVYMADYNSAIVLFLIVVINACIGFFQEYKAEKIMNALRMMIRPKAKAIRKGQEVEVKSDELVPGDIVKLEEGDAIPADIRIFEHHKLSTNDFALTGESNPTRKFAHAIPGIVSLGDRNNIAFMGTTVATGNGLGVVVGTGMSTEIGRIAHLSQTTKTELSPLQRELNNVAWRLTLITIVIAAIMLLITLGVHFTLREAFIFAVGIASCMVPQGLPSEVSVALSLAASRLAAKKAVIKKLSAVETLGATHIICTDKTGTLTKNEMTVQKLLIGDREYRVTGTGYEPKGNICDKNGRLIPKNEAESMRLFFETGVLASNARVSPPDNDHPNWYSIGDPTEAALITLGEKTGLDPQTMDKQMKELKEYPFDAVRKRMSSVRSRAGKRILYVKGAPQSILERCARIWDGKNIRPITENDRTLIKQKDDEFASQALRNIAFAYRNLDGFSEATTMEEAENNLVFLGLASMIDPPRDEVKDAMEMAAKAHIRVIIVTGDYALTAKAIAKRIKMGGAKATGEIAVVTGKELASLSDIALLQKLTHANLIFARTSPEDKLRIVNLLKKAGEIVAVTGDGVNDAPALKRADIGVAMGKTGTEVAKDASEIILLDDSFATLVSAVKEGRTIFRNISKTIRSNITTNTGELTIVLLSLAAFAFFNLPLAILTLQILSIDMVGQILPLTFLTWDPAQKAIMTQAPRNPEDHIFNRKAFKNILWSGGLMGLIAYLNFLLLFTRHGIPILSLTAENPLYARATTLTYVTSVVLSFMNILSKRVGDTESIFSSYLWSNRRLLIGFAISLGFVLLLVYTNVANTFLHMAPLTAGDWLFTAAGGLIYLAIYEAMKGLNRIRKS